MDIGRADAAARHKQPIEQLQAAKESLRLPVSAADNDGTSAPPKEAEPPKHTDERPEHNHNWTPWIIRACLAGGSLAYIFARGNPLGPEPKLSDFYVPNSGQRDRDIAFVVLGMAATGLVAYKLAK